MDHSNLVFKRIDLTEIDAIRALFVSVFTAEPWNDDWSDETQLNLYLHDLAGHSHSLTYGLYEDGQLIGLSMGHIKHWYSGTEYLIDELCIRADKQGKGFGSYFLEQIEQDIQTLGMVQIFLLTDNDVPAYHSYKKHGYYELKKNVAFAKEL